MLVYARICLNRGEIADFLIVEFFQVLGDVLPGLPWTPVIENEKVPGAFLVDEPSKLLQRKSDIPWILGMNSDDGGLMALSE